MTTIALPRTALPHLPRVDRALTRQLLRYVVVGGMGTVVSALLYLVFRTWWDAVPANLAAIVLSTVASTEANRRFTFGGRAVARSRVYLQNAGTVVFYAFYSSAVLLVLGDLVDDPTALQETAAVAAASVVGGLVRFLVLRNWVFSSHGATGRPTRRLRSWRRPAPRPSSAGRSRSWSGSRPTGRPRGRSRRAGTGWSPRVPAPGRTGR
jgi:putative flippase GtrA